MSELAGHWTHTELVAEVERLRERVANYERYVEREIEPKLLAEAERLREAGDFLAEKAAQFMDTGRGDLDGAIEQWWRMQP
jgi:hypothetical protein